MKDSESPLLTGGDFFFNMPTMNADELYPNWKLKIIFVHLYVRDRARMSAGLKERRSKNPKTEEQLRKDSEMALRWYYRAKERPDWPEIHERINKNALARYHANPEKTRERHKKRYAEDIQYRTICKWRAHMKRAATSGKSNKYIESVIGCSAEDLKKHIESQFVDGMCWENYGNKDGQWSYDHIIPCAKFDLSMEGDIRKCYHYKNVRPLWHKENCSKSSIVDGIKWTKHVRLQNECVLQ